MLGSLQGLEVTEGAILLADYEETRAVLRCDRADILAAAGRVEEAEEEYLAVFSECCVRPVPACAFPGRAEREERRGGAGAL